MIRLPFMHRLKMLSRDIIYGKNFALNRTQSYEVEILPSSKQRRGPQSSRPGIPAIDSDR